MGMYDRDWYREDYRRRNAIQHNTRTTRNTTPRQSLGDGFLPGLCLGLMIAPVITLCVLFALGYRL